MDKLVVKTNLFGWVKGNPRVTSKAMCGLPIDNGTAIRLWSNGRGRNPSLASVWVWVFLWKGKREMHLPWCLPKAFLHFFFLVLACALSLCFGFVHL